MPLTLTDSIVNPTELKQRQKDVLKRVRKGRFVTLRQTKGEDLVIADRGDFLSTLESLENVRAVLKYIAETRLMDDQRAQSIQFPWVKFLSAEERRQFSADLLEATLLCADIGSWEALRDLLGDWQATAEAHRTPGLMEAWRSRGTASDYSAVTRRARG